MAVQIQIRRGIGTEWSSVNPTLADGEIAYDKTAKQIKIGDGAANWNTLPYFSPAISGTIGVDTQITQLIIAGIATAQIFDSTVATGTAPISVASSTLNLNLNADLLDGQHGSYYQNASNINSGTLDNARLPSNVSITNLNASGIGTFGTLGVTGLGTFGVIGVTGIGTFGSLRITGFSTFNEIYVSGIATFGSNIKLDSTTGVVTATSYHGSGQNLTGIVTSIVAGTNITISSSQGEVTINASGGGGGSGSGIGTPLSPTEGDVLNLIYKTPKSTTVPSSTEINIQSDAASGNIAFTRLDSIVVSTGSTVIVSTGTTFIMNVLNIF